ncbi:hypothetical protein GJ496_003086 [Pomphorhynchus laevis]|nr:hypothetical protein GJ496_003086 [Pomphorhynchus laevis]
MSIVSVLILSADRTYRINTTQKWPKQQSPVNTNLGGQSELNKANAVYFSLHKLKKANIPDDTNGTLPAKRRADLIIFDNSTLEQLERLFRRFAERKHPALL